MTELNKEQAADLTGYREQYSHYAKRLLSDLGLAEIGQPERGQLLEAIEHYVERVMVNTLLESLNEEQLNEAEGIMNRGGDMEQVLIHLLSTTPNVEVKMADALAQAYARMLEESRQLAKAITSTHSGQSAATDQDETPLTGNKEATNNPSQQ